MENLYLTRTVEQLDIDLFLSQVQVDFGLENIENYKIICQGFDDLNLKVVTTTKTYLLKIFNKTKSLNESRRYVEMMKAILAQDIRTPMFYENSKGNLLGEYVYNNQQIHFCIMDFIISNNVNLVEQSVSQEAILDITHQLTLINSSGIQPSLLYDDWSLLNLITEYKIKKDYLTKDDSLLFQPIIKEFRAIDWDNLPHCFVHGDIARDNIILDSKGDNWIIDFTCANYYPRIIELAILANDVLFEENDKAKSIGNMQIALEAYNEKIPLTIQERKIFPLLVRSKFAMYVLMGNYLKCATNYQNEFNDYFLARSRKGLALFQDLSSSI